MTQFNPENEHHQDLIQEAHEVIQEAKEVEEASLDPDASEWSRLSVATRATHDLQVWPGRKDEVRTLEIKNGLLELDCRDLSYEKGNHIWIRVKGFKGNPQDDEKENTQIMIEWYDKKLQVHVWNDSNNPTSYVEPRDEYKKVMEAEKEDLPLLVTEIKDPEAIDLLQERLKEELI